MTLLPHRMPAAAFALLVAVICLLAAAPAKAQSGGIGEQPPTPGEPIGNTPFDKHGMWIWYVSLSHGGDPARIIRRARNSRVGTVYVKSGDGGDPWTQFNRPFIRRLKRGGLDVCAWHFVYGEHPAAEARVAAAAIKKGADCFVIDAETHYEGRYAQADRFIRILRRKVGVAYPISLASFPWTDYHPAFPYSVFMGPRAAQYNQPQMYWDAIGVTVREVYEHSWPVNQVYKRPIYPIGQTYGPLAQRELQQFRRFSLTFGAVPVSWWDWQETDRTEWKTLGRRITRGVPGYRARVRLPRLSRGSKGDMVVWAQQHLRGAGKRGLPVTGIFGPRTERAVRSFQKGRGIRVNGAIDHLTWGRLLRVRPDRVNWSRRATRRARADGRRARRSLAPAAPLSASLPARANELRGLPPR